MEGTIKSLGLFTNKYKLTGTWEPDIKVTHDEMQAMMEGADYGEMPPMTEDDLAGYYEMMKEAMPGFSTHPLYDESERMVE